MQMGNGATTLDGSAPTDADKLRDYDPKMFEKDNATQTTSPKQFVPISQRAVWVRLYYEGSSFRCPEDDRYVIRRLPVFGVVHWADADGVSHYRYLTDGSGCEIGTTPGEIEPYWDFDPQDPWKGGLIFPDTQTPEEIASEIDSWKSEAKRHWEEVQAEKLGGEVLLAWKAREEARDARFATRMTEEERNVAIRRTLMAEFNPGHRQATDGGV